MPRDVQAGQGKIDVAGMTRRERRPGRRGNEHRHKERHDAGQVHECRRGDIGARGEPGQAAPDRERDRRPAEADRQRIEGRHPDVGIPQLRVVGGRESEWTGSAKRRDGQKRRDDDHHDWDDDECAERGVEHGGHRKLRERRPHERGKIKTRSAATWTTARVPVTIVPATSGLTMSHTVPPSTRAW